MPTKGERIHAMIRRQVMTENAYDPAGIRDHESSTHWRERVDAYIFPARTAIEVRRVNVAIGVGVFARKAMPAGKRLVELRGLDGPTVPRTSRQPSIRWVSQQGRWRCRKLLGPLAFVNHGCHDCANVTPYDWYARETGARGWKDWAFAMTLRPIEVGEELLVHYGSVGLPCRRCNN